MSTTQITHANTEYKDVLNFWFDKDHKALWFKKDSDFDKKISENFMVLYNKARENKLTSWLEKADSALALIIVVDQFPRNMFRNTPKSFETDNLALRYAKLSINKGHNKNISSDKLAFLYMPFMHSENILDQNMSVKLFEKYGLTNNLEYAKEHRDIIKRFGRFPHRNIILGRTTTPEEDKFLKEEHSGF
ncbi:MAG: DUF924 domain-containing protein [Legionellales bacterium]|nr:DUF924 domain-containing protein [Legionellales bacterium]